MPNTLLRVHSTGEWWNQLDVLSFWAFQEFSKVEAARGQLRGGKDVVKPPGNPESGVDDPATS